MKSGVIVYLVGGAEVPPGMDVAARCRELGLNPDRVEVVGGEGFYDVQEAWHYLLTQGYGRIQLLVARPEDDHLRPVHPPVRLYG
ncbi:MAG: hypothetical protein WHT07_09370 [Desulfobaccales bacterium]|jgi:hypothetical protein